jgi:pimeloyl-ACP methyl ester carboxylesterase
VELLLREVVVDGVRLRYLERDAVGDAGKPALVFLHGLVASAETFAALIAEMPEAYRVIALDLPGKEVGGRRDMGLAALAGLVRAFSEAVGLGRPVVVGHSHGGAVTLQMAVMFPESVRGLVLLCPAHPFLLRERRLIAFYNSRVGGMVARSLRWFPTPFQGIGFKRLMGPKGRAAKVDFRPYRTSLNDPATVGLVLRMIKTWNEDMDALRRLLEAEPIRLPTVFLWGDRDPVVPIGTAAALQRHMTRWEQFTLRRVGHLPNDEVPGECGALIRTWLIWLETGRLAAGR